MPLPNLQILIVVGGVVYFTLIKNKANKFKQGDKKNWCAKK